MATLHGWLNAVTIREETKALFDELSKTEGIIYNHVCMNGECGCQFFIDHNHYGFHFKFLFETIEKILEIDAGFIHGIIYLMDDESEYGNEWQVFVIRKGKIYREKDVYLSPSREKIGDYY